MAPSPPPKFQPRFGPLGDVGVFPSLIGVVPSKAVIGGADGIAAKGTVPKTTGALKCRPL